MDARPADSASKQTIPPVTTPRRPVDRPAHKVSSPLRAAIATLALNAAVWLRRGLLIAAAPWQAISIAHIEAEISLNQLLYFAGPSLVARTIHLVKAHIPVLHAVNSDAAASNNGANSSIRAEVSRDVGPAMLNAPIGRLFSW